MKNQLKHLVILLVLLSTPIAYAGGIEFEHLSLEDGLSKAKAENKLVFIDTALFHEFEHG